MASHFGSSSGFKINNANFQNDNHHYNGPMMFSANTYHPGAIHHQATVMPGPDGNVAINFGGPSATRFSAPPRAPMREPTYPTREPQPPRQPSYQQQTGSGSGSGGHDQSGRFGTSGVEEVDPTPPSSRRPTAGQSPQSSRDNVEQGDGRPRPSDDNSSYFTGVSPPPRVASPTGINHHAQAQSQQQTNRTASGQSQFHSGRGSKTRDVDALMALANSLPGSPSAPAASPSIPAASPSIHAASPSVSAASPSAEVTNTPKAEVEVPEVKKEEDREAVAAGGSSMLVPPPAEEAKKGPPSLQEPESDARRLSRPPPIAQSKSDSHVNEAGAEEVVEETPSTSAEASGSKVEDKGEIKIENGATRTSQDSADPGPSSSKKDKKDKKKRPSMLKRFSSLLGRKDKAKSSKERGASTATPTFAVEAT